MCQLVPSRSLPGDGWREDLTFRGPGNLEILAHPLLADAPFSRASPPLLFARVQALGDAYEEYGFVILRNHGVSESLIARNLESAKAFFALPTEEKMKYHLEGQGGASATPRSG